MTEQPPPFPVIAGAVSLPFFVDVPSNLKLKQLATFKTNPMNDKTVHRK